MYFNNIYVRNGMQRKAVDLQIIILAIVKTNDPTQYRETGPVRSLYCFRPEAADGRVMQPWYITIFPIYQHQGNLLKNPFRQYKIWNVIYIVSGPNQLLNRFTAAINNSYLPHWSAHGKYIPNGIHCVRIDTVSYEQLQVTTILGGVSKRLMSS